MPTGRYTDVIERMRPEAATPGEIVHLDGRVLGRHDGVIHYTVGQRRGLGIASGEPLYVIRIEAASARVFVGPREALQTRLIHLRDINWIGDRPLMSLQPEGLEIAVRVRSTRPPQAARLLPVDGEICVELPAGEYGVSPGQACVFYDSTDPRARVLGGGSIIRPKADLVAGTVSLTQGAPASYIRPVSPG